MTLLQFSRSAARLPESRSTAPSPIRLFVAGNVEPQPRPTGDWVWGIASRQGLVQRLRIVGELAPKAPLSFLAVEVAGLYAVNVAALEETGASLLEAVAHATRALTRSTDIVGHVSASSLGVVLQGAGETAAGAAAARLTRALNEIACDWRGASVRVSAATGTGVNAMALFAAALDGGDDCC